MSNMIRTAVLLAMLFGIVFAMLFAGALLFELWITRFHPETDVLANAVHDVGVLAPYVAIATAGWIVIALVANRHLIGVASGMRPVPKGRYPRLERTLERLCQRANMPVPHLAVIDTEEMNAFASGLSQDDYTVTFTAGLLRRLTEEEMEGVMAHELTHIKNRDVRLMVIAATVTGGIALVFEWVFLAVWHGAGVAVSSAVGGVDNDVFSGWFAIVLCLPLLIIAWFVSQLTGLAISRTREYMADAGAAALTGKPAALISALQKITEDCDIDAPSGIMRMCIQTPDSVIELFLDPPERRKSHRRTVNQRAGPQIDA